MRSQCRLNFVVAYLLHSLCIFVHDTIAIVLKQGSSSSPPMINPKQKPVSATSSYNPIMHAVTSSVILTISVYAGCDCEVASKIQATGAPPLVDFRRRSRVYRRPELDSMKGGHRSMYNSMQLATSNKFLTIVQYSSCLATLMFVVSSLP